MLERMHGSLAPKFGEMAMTGKEEIKRALRGELFYCFDDDGEPVYNKAGREECEKEILRIYDYLYYQAEQLRASGCAVEKVYPLNPKDMGKYMRYMMEEQERTRGDYEFEDSNDE